MAIIVNRSTHTCVVDSTVSASDVVSLVAIIVGLVDVSTPIVAGGIVVTLEVVAGGVVN